MKTTVKMLFCLMLCSLLLLCACATETLLDKAPSSAEPSSDTSLESISPSEPSQTATPIAVSALPSATPLAASPLPSATPSPAVMTLGAIGDIMITASQVRDARIDKSDEYDFTPCFSAMAPVMQAVDLMCGNLESVLGGPDSGYSGVPYGDSELASFCAPDALAKDLAACGFDVLTTANNHCLDRGSEGLYRTIEVVRQAGLTQTGTFLNAQDRATPCIVEVNGIRIGIVTATRLINNRVKRIATDESRIAIAQLYDSCDSYTLTDELKADIATVKAAGADFIVGFIHWDYETSDPVAKETKLYAAALLQEGVDCILGSHPHRVKSCEYVTVDRDGEPYTGLVVYSMGNFIANQATEQSIGCFIRLTIEKPYGGKAALIDAGYLPTVCYKQEQDGVSRFEVAPVLSDPLLIQSRFVTLSDKYLRRLEDGRVYTANKLGGEGGLRLLEDAEVVAFASPLPSNGG